MNSPFKYIQMNCLECLYTTMAAKCSAKEELCCSIQSYHIWINFDMVQVEGLLYSISPLLSNKFNRYIFILYHF